MLKYLNYTLIQQASQYKLNTEKNIKQLILDDKSKGISNQNRQFIINTTLCSYVLRATTEHTEDSMKARNSLLSSVPVRV